MLSDLRITTKKLLQVWRTLFVVFPQNANFQSPKSYFFFNGLKSTTDFVGARFARTIMNETINEFLNTVFCLVLLEPFFPSYRFFIPAFRAA